MAIVASSNLLQITQFSSIDKWSADKSLLNNTKSPYPLKPLRKVLVRIKDQVLVEDKVEYKRITVRLYGMGVSLRDEVLGVNIGTKKQFKAKTGQLIISRIDARNGAFGIVPEELDGAIVTNDFWLFDVTKALPQYLTLILSSKVFRQYWQTKSSGTTNRQRVEENDFLDSPILLPDTTIQNDLVNKYLAEIKKAEDAESEAIQLEKSIEDYMLDMLGIRNKTCFGKESILTFTRFHDIQQWGYDKIATPFPYEFKKYKPQSLANNPIWFIELTRGKSPQYSITGSSLILNQKCNRWDEIDLSFAKKIDDLWMSKLDNSLLTSKNDILINSTGEGTLGRASVVRDFAHIGLPFDSHMILLRLDTRFVSPQLFVYIFNSSFGQKQVDILKGAQATKQTELGIENVKRVLLPLPDIHVQNEMASYISDIKQKIYIQKKNARNFRDSAKEKFEQNIFANTF